MGTHFGGSLYAMVDPQYMLMLMQVLGGEYYVWDKAAAIKFVKPGRGTVRATFKLSDEEISDIKKQTAGGEKYFPSFNVNVIDESGDVVAKINKTLYVRRKKECR